MEEADVMDAARQSNLDINSYIKKAGIQAVDDNYSLNGKSFSAEDILDAAKQSKLGFDDYIQKAGFQKKSSNGSENGQQEPSEQPAVTTSSSLEGEDLSGQRPESYPLPEQPKPSGFKPKINLSQPQEQVAIPPAPKKTPIDVLREDYLSNKVDNDKSLTSKVGDDPAFGQFVQGETLLKEMVDPNTDNRLLSKYSTKRRRDLDNELLERKAILEEKYKGNISTYGVPTSPKYYEELAELQKEIEGRKDNIIDAAREVANKKVLNAEFKKVAQPKFVNKNIGREVRRAVGDPTLAREERLEMKGVPLSPSEQYYNDKVGYIAKASVLKDMTDRGVDIQNNPVAKKLYESVKDGRDKLFSEHKDFTRQQAARLISDEISRDKNWFQLMTGAYTINDKDIKKYAKKLGIPDNIADQVHEKDIHTSNMFGEFVNELAARPGANIGTFIGRPFRREVLGQDPDAIDAHYEALNKKFTTFLADAPDAQAQFANPTEIERDPNKENYLEDIRNVKQGKFNWSVPAIANSIANGAGQMIQYGLGGSALGGGLKAIGAINKIEKAKDVGLVTYGFLNSYESGYQKGRELVGDSPDKEAQRNIIGSLYAGIQAFSELIFKDYKVTDKLFSVKNSGSKQLLEMLAKAKAEDAAKVLTSATGKKTLAAAIKEGVVKTGKGTLEEIGEEEAALLGDVVLSTVTNKKSLDDRNIPEEFIQTAVVTALSAAVPIGLGEMRQTNRTSGIKKSMIHEIGIDPNTYIAHIAAEAAEGKIPEKLANRKISIVNTMADIVNKGTPDVSPINGKQLSEKDKIDYSYNLLHTSFLNNKLEVDKKTDPVQEKITEEKLKELAKERVGILQNADGIEKNFNGQPIYERDQIPEPTKEEQQKDILAGRMATFTYEDESQVPDIFKGHISSTGETNGKKFVRVTVAQNLADYALSTGGEQQAQPERHTGTPEEISKAIELTTQVPAQDYTGKDNNFLANKEEGFFTPAERETYNELMKTPETEGQAAQMVADKKEEIKKFAPQPLSQAELPLSEKLTLARQNLPEFDNRSDMELAKIADTRAKELLAERNKNATTIKPEEEVAATEVAPPEVPAEAAEPFRSEEEVQKILNEEFKKPGDFVKKFKVDVSYQDIVTGETKTGKTYQAKKDLEERYNKVNNLIVNCLT